MQVVSLTCLACAILGPPIVIIVGSRTFNVSLWLFAAGVSLLYGLPLSAIAGVLGGIWLLSAFQPAEPRHRSVCAGTVGAVVGSFIVGLNFIILNMLFGDPRSNLSQVPSTWTQFALPGAISGIICALICLWIVRKFEAKPPINEVLP